MGITKKLVILNSIIIVLLVAISVTTMSLISNYTLSNDLKQTLLNSVSRNAAELRNSDGIVYFDSNFKYYDNEVYFSVYNEEQYFINGLFPENHDPKIPLVNGSIRSYTYKDVTYTYYDYLIELHSRSNVYIRGIISQKSNMAQVLSITSSIIIPLLAILGMVGSIIVSKSVTKPILEISKMTKTINSSEDLKLRLNVKSKDKEIVLLQKSYNDMLEKLSKIFLREEEFTSDVSHELRTPLTIILSECEYALEVNGTKDKNESLEIMHKQISRMIYMVNDLLVYSRLSKNDQIEKEKINVSELLEEIRINKADITFTKQLEPNIYLDINENLFIRLIQNLVDNAAKYNHENGNVNLKLFNDLSSTVIEVSDNGIGISKEDIPYIFDRFYQVDKSRHSSQSFGLGLSFVKEIVRLHNATISVNSELNQGSTFKISFRKIA